jgi:hypothetical protein
MNACRFSTVRALRGACAVGLALTCAAPIIALAGASAPAATVRVERVRPAREKLPTLRFLRTNREFFRSRLDRLRETPLAVREGAQDIDPRYLAWRDMLAAVRAAGDSVALAEDADQRRELFASVADLHQLEAQLDAMDRLLADQRVRLASLEEDFAGHQRTALAVVVSGWPHGDAPSELSLSLDDGTRLALPLSSEQRSALAEGGVLELFHGLIEPREQSFAIALSGTRWAAADSGFVTLSPERDRLTFVRLDLSGVAPESGAGGIVASTWLHDDAPDADRERSNRP